jgi:hypothetical protein
MPPHQLRESVFIALLGEATQEVRIGQPPSGWCAGETVKVPKDGAERWTGHETILPWERASIYL